MDSTSAAPDENLGNRRENCDAWSGHEPAGETSGRADVADEVLMHAHIDQKMLGRS